MKNEYFLCGCRLDFRILLGNVCILVFGKLEGGRRQTHYLQISFKNITRTYETSLFLLFRVFPSRLSWRVIPLSLTAVSSLGPFGRFFRQHFWPRRLALASQRRPRWTLPPSSGSLNSPSAAASVVQHRQPRWFAVSSLILSGGMLTAAVVSRR